MRTLDHQGTQNIVSIWPQDPGPRHLTGDTGLRLERATVFEKASHSAGYDATITAEVFLMEADMGDPHKSGGRI